MLRLGAAVIGLRMGRVRNEIMLDLDQDRATGNGDRQPWSRGSSRGVLRGAGPGNQAGLPVYYHCRGRARQRLQSDKPGLRPRRVGGVQRPQQQGGRRDGGVRGRPVGRRDLAGRRRNAERSDGSYLSPACPLESLTFMSIITTASPPPTASPSTADIDARRNDS